MSVIKNVMNVNHPESTVCMMDIKYQNYVLFYTVMAKCVDISGSTRRCSSNADTSAAKMTSACFRTCFNSSSYYFSKTVLFWQQ